MDLRAVLVAYDQAQASLGRCEAVDLQDLRAHGATETRGERRVTVRIELVAGEDIGQVSTGAVTFTPFGVYIQESPETDRLIPWANVKAVGSNQREVYRLMQEAKVF